jgi:hypothetical protein
MCDKCLVDTNRRWKNRYWIHIADEWTPEERIEIVSYIQNTYWKKKNK